MASNIDFLKKIRSQQSDNAQANQNSGQDSGTRSTEASAIAPAADAQPSEKSGANRPAEEANAAAAQAKSGFRLGFLVRAGGDASVHAADSEQVPATVGAGEQASADPGGLGALGTANALARADDGDNTSESAASNGPAGFQAKLDELDVLCRHEAGITEFTHDAVKKRVSELMIELKANPEMENLVIDRDVHNIMLYVQSASRMANKQFEQTAVTRAKRENNSNKKSIAKANMSDAFDQMFGSLEALAELNTDGMPAVSKK